MRSRAVAVAVALAGAVLGLIATGPASAVQPGRAEEPLVRVGTEGTYPPFTYVDPRSQQLTGFDVEVIKAVAKKAGWQLKFVQSPFDAIFPALDAHRIDVIANQITINPEREARYLFTQPYTYSHGVIVTSADNDDIKTLADLKGRTAGESETSNWAQVARDAGANVEAVEGFVQAIQLLKDGRVDATVNDTLAVGEYQRTNNDAGIKIAGTTGDTSEQAFAARKDSGIIADVNRALGELRADGTLKQISEKYFGTDVSAAA
jgi:L-cystine transport system substrate-binding protein